ncbi:hypothetical protein DMH01_02420 [Amycolatopsis sp. WAC 04182]|uniref:AAA family ATPase n=1 Tax=Amycolatopsis sp. WAC 04182 TaxID=2203198 RepID=UPI000F7A0C13|nr:AAA family ATPase [Amycolatopsis sp. WAC 04182]RSN65268.1 hypothetical protein DMH01_02420 [Amycolatopsis sp. WAC 04182]
MLTRIEIDGFKSFDRFGLDLPPFLVVLGQNASGKSNLFDAIRLLGRLGNSSTLVEAFAETRGSLTEQFRAKGGREITTSMRFAAEMLLDSAVTDQFGEQVAVEHDQVRYELDLELRLDRVRDSIAIYVAREVAYPIGRPDAPFLETVGTGDSREFVLSSENGGKGRRSPANAARATVLSTIRLAAEFPVLFAIRNELEFWRFLQLDPSALRLSGATGQSDAYLEPGGGNLAMVLRRIGLETRDEYGSGLDDIVVDLGAVVRGISDVGVDETATGRWEIRLVTRDGPISARVASDGTLRVLALLAALHDPQHRGLMCFEEPENGIFPQRLRELLHVLRNMVMASVSDGPRLQVILSSHSPLMLFELDPAEVVVMDTVTQVGPEERKASTVSRVRALTESETLERVSDHEQRALPGIGRDEALRLLEA